VNGHGADAAADVRLRRRYALLLSCYPPAHRREHAEEMLEVLLATARPGQRWHRPGDTVDLVVGAVLIRVRRAGTWLTRAACRGPEPLSSVVSLLAPVLLVAGAGTGGAHELFWFLWHGDLGRIPLDVVVPDVPSFNAVTRRAFQAVPSGQPVTRMQSFDGFASRDSRCAETPVTW
jgi:hypothetical protein